MRRSAASSASRENAAPDVCSVATSGYENGSDHYEPTIQALEFGCHVLGEKPISNEVEEAERREE